MPITPESSPRFALNALLGLRDEPGYLEWLHARLGRDATPRRARQWLSAGTVKKLRSAARSADDAGSPYRQLADLLAGVKYVRDGGAAPSISATDLPALAAYALVEAIRLDARIDDCPECGQPWVASRAVFDYCSRPAPGLKLTCSQVHKHERFAADRLDWNREYRRIYARKLRGSISEADWAAWRSEQTPDRWVSFDSWKDLQPLTDAMRKRQQRDQEKLRTSVAELARLARKSKGD